MFLSWITWWAFGFFSFTSQWGWCYLLWMLLLTQGWCNLLPTSIVTYKHPFKQTPVSLSCVSFKAHFYLKSKTIVPNSPFADESRVVGCAAMDIQLFKNVSNCGHSNMKLMMKLELVLQPLTMIFILLSIFSFSWKKEAEDHYSTIHLFFNYHFYFVQI